MSFDLFSAVGLTSYYLYFPLFFIFYFFWINLMTLVNSLNKLVLLKNFLVNTVYKIVNLGVLVYLSFFSFFISVFFLFMLYSNMWNLVPYSIMVSSNMFWTLLIAFLVWSIIKISSLTYKILSYNSHFTPEGSPIVLVPFMNMIELISNCIRPITLGVRLAVNLLTGHLLLSMFSGFSMILLLDTKILFIFALIMGSFIYVYESGVAVVQAFVFNLMIGQYANEHTC